MKILQKTILGVDLHDYSIEMVELNSRNKKYKLESYNRIAIPEKLIVNGEISDEDEIKTILKKLLQTADPGPALSKNVSVLLPSSKVMTHIFKLAGSLSESEIRRSLPYEAEMIIPFAFEDIYWDFSVLKKVTEDKKTFQYVLFACIHKDVAEKYAKLFDSVGLNPVSFGINAESLKNAVSNQMEKDKTYLILDVGALSVDYLVIKNNVILNYFSSNEGGRKFVCSVADIMHESEEEVFKQKEIDGLNCESTLDQAVKFMERCYKRGREIIKDYESSHADTKIDAVVFTGVFMNLPEFYKKAEEIYEGLQILIANPKASLSIDDKRFHVWRDRNDESRNTVPYSIYFTNAIGIAVKGLLNEGINLLPDRYKETQIKKRNNFLMVAATLAMTAITVFLTSALVVEYFSLTYSLKSLEIKKAAVQQIIYGTRYKQIYDHILAFNKEVDILSRIDAGTYSSEGIVNAVYSKIPKGIKINSWNFSDKDLTFRIYGVASDRTALLNVQKNLGQIDFVKDVVAPISNFDEKTNISFSITIKMDFTKLPHHVPSAQQNGENL